ncbi:MAG: helix-turn-helix transcriptional regulator [Acidobacteria bacterium]|nr:helix-turn-helix transcriptional regulator [Acidobacteriota bacterium]
MKKTLSPTLAEGLGAYGIGEKLRALRLKRKLGLIELGRHTGLSPAMLSKLERGLLFPTLPTLLRVALVYGVGLDHFFAAAAPRRALGIVRAAERKRFPEKLGGREVAWEFECLDFTATERVMNAYRVRFLQAGRKPRTHEHAGAEFLHVLSGRLALVIAGDEHVLDEGDSIYFDSSQTHGYCRLGPRPAEAIVVTVPG